MMNSRRRAREAILEIVDNQIRDLTPPETKETFDRLSAQGLAPDEVRRLFGCVVAGEFFGILKYRQPYDEDRYIKSLRKLPDLPE
jgi:hypothetical protein